jgi:hypothetical protein
MASPDLSAFRWDVLASAEEDWVMLVHVWWEAQKFGSGRRLSARLALAEDVVSDLLERGYVEAGRMRPPQTDFQWEPVPQDQLKELLTHYGSWVAPDAEHVWLRLTESGRLALDQAVDRRIP